MKYPRIGEIMQQGNASRAGAAAIRRRVRCSARHLACTWLGGRCGVSAPAPLTAAVRVSASAAALPGGAPVAGSRGPVRVTFRDERSEHAQVTARYAFWPPGTGSRRSAPRRTFCRTRRHRGVPARASWPVYRTCRIADAAPSYIYALARIPPSLIHPRRQCWDRACRFCAAGDRTL